MGRPRKYPQDSAPIQNSAPIKDPNKKTDPTEPCHWFILQGFCFNGIMYNRGEQVPAIASPELLQSLYERKYIGRITPGGVKACSTPTILTESEMLGLHKFSPLVLKSYIEARNISKDSLERIVNMNKLNPESLNIVLSRLATVEALNCDVPIAKVG